MKKNWVGILILVLLAIVAAGWWRESLSAVNREDTAKKDVIIPKGQDLSETADQLYDLGLIRSSLIFKILARQQGVTEKVMSGTFKLSPSQSAQDVLEILTSQPEESWITLLEGWRVEEMAEELSSKLEVQSAEFLEVSKEGYMFPDTYLIPHDYTVNQIARLMRDNFDKKYTPELRQKIRQQNLTEEEGVILASIVEREARSDKARTEIAGILLKRLKISMGLNADAAIQYALGYQSGEKSWWKRHLTSEDLKVESPYNTYLYRGLPPTPISNPSLSSLQAVASADSKTPYLYYYHDSKGNSYYAATLEEHSQNIVNNP